MTIRKDVLVTLQNVNSNSKKLYWNWFWLRDWNARWWRNYAAVQEAPSDDDDEEDASPPISNKIALESIQILYSYLEQNNDIEVNSQFVSGLRDLKWKIRENMLLR